MILGTETVVKNHSLLHFSQWRLYEMLPLWFNLPHGAADMTSAHVFTLCVTGSVVIGQNELKIILTH